MDAKGNPVIVPDYHLHTALCKHARGAPSEYREAARTGGIREICFTDHAPSPDGYDAAHRMEMGQFDGYRRMVTSLRDGEAPAVLFGIEADYYAGCEAFLGKWIPAQRFDFVLGSVHSIDGWGFDNPAERHRWESADVKGVWARYFRLIESLVDLGLFHAVGHLDLPKKFGHRPSDADLREMVQPVLDRIAAAGMGIEVNTSGLRKPVGEIYPSPLILSLACERGVPICFGSDAHRPDEVGSDFRTAVNLVKAAGFVNHFRMRGGKMILFPLPR